MQDRESLPAKDRRSTTVQRNQLRRKLRKAIFSDHKPCFHYLFWRYTCQLRQRWTEMWNYTHLLNSQLELDHKHANGDHWHITCCKIHANFSSCHMSDIVIFSLVDQHSSFLTPCLKLYLLRKPFPLQSAGLLKTTFTHWHLDQTFCTNQLSFFLFSCYGSMHRYMWPLWYTLHICYSTYCAHKQTHSIHIFSKYQQSFYNSKIRWSACRLETVNLLFGSKLSLPPASTLRHVLAFLDLGHHNSAMITDRRKFTSK